MLNGMLPQGPLPQLNALRQPLELSPIGAFSQRGSSRTYGHDIDIAELQGWVRQDMDRWDQRNQRFWKEQDLYKLTTPTSIPVRNRNNVVTLNDPKALVNKVVRILARHHNIIDVDPAPGVDPNISQKIENTLYMIDRAINQRWVMALHNPYRWDQAFSATLRGWICERTMVDPTGTARLRDDPSALWNHQVVDPACVYPYVAGGDVRRVTHSYQTTVGDLCHDPLLTPFIDPDWHEQDYRSLCHVTAVYWQAADGGWYHAILGGVGPGSGLAGNGGLWIKQPMELGYNPWTIVLCGGAFYRETPWDDTEFIEDVGTGILDAICQNQSYMDRMVTRLNELLAQESNPALTVYTNSGRSKPVDMSAGARNWFAADDKVEVHRIGPKLDDFEMLFKIFSERQARGGISDAFFADNLMQGQNGLAAATALAAARDVLFPFAEGVNTADALKYRKFLELYRDFGPGMALPSKLTQGNGMAQGLGQFSQMIAQQMGGQQPGQSPFAPAMAAGLDVWELMQQGCYVNITREDMTPQEIAARINLATLMVDKNIISRETARKDYVKLRNPSAENVRIISEMVYQDPRLIQLLIPLTLSDTGQNQLRMMYEFMQNMVPPGMGSGQPGQPPAPNPNEPPSGMDHGQLPTQVTPPAMMGDPLTNVRVGQMDPMQAMMQLMTQGNAVGGMGQGGIPPTPQPGSFRGTPAQRGF